MYDYADLLCLQLIGRPYFPAYWTLGFQLCRYGYNNMENLQAAVNRTIESKIPFVSSGKVDAHFKTLSWVIILKNQHGKITYSYLD